MTKAQNLSNPIILHNKKLVKDYNLEKDTIRNILQILLACRIYSLFLWLELDYLFNQDYWGTEKFVDMFSKLIAYKFALNFSCADVERFSSRESSVK